MLFETIRVENGEFQNLKLHQWRVNWSREKIGFSNLFLELPKPPENGIFRCRVTYYKQIEKVEFIPYELRIPKNFTPVFCEDIKYDLKSLNREDIDLLKKEKEEIIIVRKNLITDTSIANIYFFDENLEKWITPKSPLLRGTFREKLLRSGKVLEKDISFKEARKFSKMGLSNAMTGFLEIDNPIS
jgi:4-amino-4-deoxychorismate lyase